MNKSVVLILIAFILSSLLVGCSDSGKLPEVKEDPPSSDLGGKTNGSGSDNSNNGGSGTSNQPVYTVGSSVGNLFADVTLETLAGGSVNTADYRGKIVVINIWATRCPPCKAELPDFDRIASEYAEDVVIIAAHEDYTRYAAPSYVETNFPSSKIIFAYDTPYGDAYYAAGGDGYIPQTAILDRNGVIIYSDSGLLSHDTLVSIIESAK